MQNNLNPELQHKIDKTEIINGKRENWAIISKYNVMNRIGLKILGILFENRSLKEKKISEEFQIKLKNRMFAKYKDVKSVMLQIYP